MKNSENKRINKPNILIFLLCFIQTFISCKTYTKSEKSEILQDNIINSNGIYISRDTLSDIDKNTKKVIRVELLKLNKNNTVQISIPFLRYRYKEGEDKMNNENITTWLNPESLFHYRKISKDKIEITCIAIMPKRKWNDFATPSNVKIKVIFKIYGDKLIQLGKSDKYNIFKNSYTLNRNFTNNHKNIRIGNECQNQVSR